MTKQLEFTYQSNPQYIDFTFSALIETYFPEKDLSTEKFRGNLMQAGIKMEEILDRRNVGFINREIL
jgi:hypothetical protein